MPPAITTRVYVLDGAKLIVTADRPRQFVAEALQALYEAGLMSNEVRIVESNLEEVFIQLTERAKKGESHAV